MQNLLPQPAPTLLPADAPADAAAARAAGDDLPAVKDCYRRFAATQDGWLDRPDVWWDNILPADKIGAEQNLAIHDGVYSEFGLGLLDGAMKNLNGPRGLGWTRLGVGEEFAGF